MAPVTATGVEARCAFKERAKAERHQQQLQAAVFGDARDGALQDLERPVQGGEPVQEDDVEDDPADREQAGNDAKARRLARHGSRHAKHERRNADADNQRQARSQMGLHMKEGQRTQQHRHRYPGRDG